MDKELLFEKHGRTKMNWLDIMLAVTCCLIAVGALLISIGMSVANAGSASGAAFLDVAKGLGFQLTSKPMGVIIPVCLVFYLSLLLLICGTIYLYKKDRKDRIPGLVSEFVAALGFIFFLALCYEYAGGKAQGTVHEFFPYALIFFLVEFGFIMFLGTYCAFKQSVNVELGPKEEAVEEMMEQPVEEPVKEEEPVEEEPEEEPEEEAEEEDEEDDEEESDEEPLEGEDGFDFSQLGKRKKRVPFEIKLRHSSNDTRHRYKVIVDELRKFDFNDRMSIPGETFSYKRVKLVFLTMSGKTLKVHFKLDPKEFEDSPLPIKDASDVKRFEELPAFIKVKSDLAARRAIALGQRLAEEHNVPQK